MSQQQSIEYTKNWLAIIKFTKCIRNFFISIHLLPFLYFSFYQALIYKLCTSNRDYDYSSLYILFRQEFQVFYSNSPKNPKELDEFIAILDLIHDKIEPLLFFLIHDGLQENYYLT